MMFAAGAHNVANVNTPGFRVSLTEEIPALIVADHGYRANATVIRAQDEMSGALLNVIA